MAAAEGIQHVPQLRGGKLGTDLREKRVGNLGHGVSSSGAVGACAVDQGRDDGMVARAEPALDGFGEQRLDQRRALGIDARFLLRD